MTNTQNDQATKEMAVQDLGARLAPLFTWRGRDVYPVFGAEGDDGDGGEPNGGSDDDGTDDDGNGGSTGGSEPVSRQEFDQLRKQLSAADKRRDEAEKKLKAHEDAKKDELTKATERVQELEKVAAQKDTELADLRLQNAFLMADVGITWHDPADALALAERQGYLSEVVGEDGSVDKAKLKAKMQELAKSKPHLVNATKDKKDKDTVAPTGQHIGSRGNGGKKEGEPSLSRYDKILNR